MTTGDVVRYAGHRWRVLVVHATCCYIARRGYERWVSRALVTPWKTKPQSITSENAHA